MIFVSAGHYPEQPGVRDGCFQEHGEVVRWADRVHDLLGHGATRVPSGTVSFKSSFINTRSTPDDLAVEFHLSKRLIEDDDTAHGCSALYDPENERSESVARKLQTAMELHFQRYRGAVPGYYARGNPVVPLHFFLEYVRCTSVIVMPETVASRGLLDIGRELCCQSIAEVLRTWA
jgi:hypothetical protein